MNRPLDPTPRTRLRQRANRGRYDRAELDAILDEALVCHVGFVAEGQPYVLPTLHVRHGDALYLHGAVASRMCRALGGGLPACVTVTILDGLVLARSAFHHSVNYRSAVVLGERPVTAEAARASPMAQRPASGAARENERLQVTSYASLRSLRLQLRVSLQRS